MDMATTDKLLIHLTVRDVVAGPAVAPQNGKQSAIVSTTCNTLFARVLLLRVHLGLCALEFKLYIGHLNSRFQSQPASGPRGYV
eukprot:6204853-Pleurochrysis_carterae.AAC.1